jgi:hypothetical protein
MKNDQKNEGESFNGDLDTFRRFFCSWEEQNSKKQQLIPFCGEKFCEIFGKASFEEVSFFGQNTLVNGEQMGIFSLFKSKESSRKIKSVLF